MPLQKERGGLQKSGSRSLAAICGCYLVGLPADGEVQTKVVSVPTPTHASAIGNLRTFIPLAPLTLAKLRIVKPTIRIER